MKGKFLGAILGVLAGGPIGALVGCAIGHCTVDSVSGRKGSKKIMSPADADFFIAHLFAACAKMAKADGAVSKLEIEALENVFKDLNIGAGMRQRAIEYFRRAKDNNNVSFSDIVSAFARKGLHPHARLAFFRVLVRVALADGNAGDAEFGYLRQAARILGIPTSVVDDLKKSSSSGKGEKSSSESEPSGSQMTLAEAYAILGVDFGTDKDSVKKIYRQKCKDLHPDVLRSKGLGDFAVKVLEQELQKVNDAYSVIEKYGA